MALEIGENPARPPPRTEWALSSIGRASTPVDMAGWPKNENTGRSAETGSGTSNAIAFPEGRTELTTLFPRPLDGAVEAISPPGLAWLPARGAGGYRVEIREAGGAEACARTTGRNPVHLPDRALPPGDYEWDVAALDADGNEAARRGVQRFTIPAGAPELPWVEPATLLERVPGEHPRILYPRARLPGIRATLQTTRKRTWELCRRAADAALDTDIPKYPSYQEINDKRRCRLEYGNYFHYLRRYVDERLIDLALAYVISAEERYATAAKRILLEIATWPTGDDDPTSVRARWGDEPGLSFSRNAHVAYDWLHDALTPDERESVRAMCEARAWQTYRRLAAGDYLSYPGESHNGRLIAYLSEMALALAGEAEGAPAWLEFSLKALTTFYPHWGGFQGGWAEGPAYGLWYNQFYIPAFESLRELCGFDLWQRPFFKNVRHFFFYCTAVRGEMRPFGDAAESGGPGTAGGRGYGDLMWFHAHRFEDPHAGWWAKQVAEWEAPRGRHALVFEDDPPSRRPIDLPQSRAFNGVGWAGLHSELADRENDTFLVFKSSPFGSVSHSHADQNAFAIMKGGRPLAVPSGYYGPSYGMPHHAEWTRSTKANNCILVDGRGQVIRDGRASGRLAAFEDAPGWTYLCGDAAPAYMGLLTRCERHILFLRPGLFLLLDDLEAPEPVSWQWMLHALEEMEIDGEQIVSRRDGATLDVRLASPAGLTVTQSDQFDAPFNAGIPGQYHKEMPDHWHVTAETRQRTAAVRIGAAMLVTGPNEASELDLLRSPGWFGVGARGAFGSVTGWVQLEPGAPGPEGFGNAVANGQAVIYGVAADGSVTVHEKTASP